MSDLAAHIRALAESGTPGPWWAQFIRGDAVPESHIIDRWFVMGCFNGNPKSPTGPTATCEYEPDAALIVAAVNALPALADLVEVVESRHWLQHGRDCAECGDEWPCPTATALDALAVALGVAQ